MPRSAKRWAAICIVVYLFELLVFSGWTAVFGVSFNLNTMSEYWLFGFYGLLILPFLIGVFAFTKGKEW